MKKKKVYGSNYSSLLLTILIVLIVYFALSFLIEDEFINNLFTKIFIPVFLLLFSSMFSKADVIGKSYIDFEIYDKRDKLPGEALLWYDKNNESSHTYCSVKNIGQSLISSVNIIINPSDPQKDICYRLTYPFSSHENLFLVLPVAANDIKKLVIIFYSNSVDKSICFEGEQVENNSCLAFSDLSSVKGYNTRKIKNYIELRRNFIHNI